MPRVLFIAAHRPDRSPSQRYRFEQFVPYWEQHGFSFEQAWLLEEEDDARFYSAGNLFAKGVIFLKGIRRRMAHIKWAQEFDLIIVQREAFMTGSTYFERALYKTGVPVVFDFDDAIWLMDVSDGNRRLSWLKDPGKTDRILGHVHHVIAGNEFLAEYARKHNKSVEVIPTVINTEKYRSAVSTGNSRPIVIGWTGSRTTIGHLKASVGMLKDVQEKYGKAIQIRVISDRPLEEPGLEVVNVPWRSATEVEDLADLDIGIMPLPENDWSRGKCGFKGLQYMAMGKAVVLQNIGVNKVIVQHGVNGYLASSREEWVDRLEDLINDNDLRTRMGTAARRTIEEKWSVIAWRDRYLELFNKLIAENK